MRFKDMSMQVKEAIIKLKNQTGVVPSAVWYIKGPAQIQEKEGKNTLWTDKT